MSRVHRWCNVTIFQDGVGVLQHSSVLKNVELLEVLLAEIHRIGGRVDEPNKVSIMIGVCYVISS